MQARTFLLLWASVFLGAAAAFGVARLLRPDLVSGLGILACGLIGTALAVVGMRIEPPAEACGACGRAYGALDFCGRCGALRPSGPTNTS